MQETLDIGKQASSTTQLFLDQGILGAVVLVLFFAIWKLWQQNNRSQEKCVELALQVAEVANTLTSSLDRNTDAIERLERDRDRREAP